MNRRRVLAVVGSAGLASLAGCTGFLDDTLNEDEQALLSDYEEVYNYQQSGVDSMESGVENYAKGSLDLALNDFEVASTQFGDAQDANDEITIKRITEVGTEENREIFTKAIGPITAAGIASSDAIEAIENLQNDTVLPPEETSEDRLTAVQADLRSGVFDMIPPEKVEDGF